MRSRLRAQVLSICLASAPALGGTCVSPPAAPSQLRLRAATASTLDVAWSDNAEKEAGFEVEWRAENACATCFSRAYVGANVTSRVIGGLVQGFRYDVRVRAWRCNAGAQLPCAGAASAPTPLATYTTRLAAPTQLQALDRQGGAGVLVKWNDASGNETEYRVERKASYETSFRAVASLPSGATQFDDKPRFAGSTWDEGALDWETYAYRVTARRRTANGAVVATSTPAAVFVATRWGDTSFESCSTLVVRPDQRIAVNDYPTHCEPVWSVNRLADSNARLALIGASDIDEPMFKPYSRGCASIAFPYDVDGDGVVFGATFRDLGGYVSAVRARRAARGGPPIEFIDDQRFDLMGTQLLAQPQYQRSFAVRTSTPFEDVLDFYTGDGTPDCTGPTPPGGCAYHPDSQVYTEQYPYYHDKRIQDFVDARAAGDHRSVVYYMARSYGSAKWHSPLAILADQRVAAYRAWRVAVAARAKPLAGIDYVGLNQKFHQYDPNQPHWLGAPAFENVHEVNVSGDAPFTAQPLNYGLAEYVEGWRALAADLRAAAVPFAVFAVPFIFRGRTSYDDPRTPYDDTAAVRDGTRDASLIVMERYPENGITDAEFRAIVSDLRGRLAPRGGRVVVVSTQPRPDDACPYQGQ